MGNGVINGEATENKSTKNLVEDICLVKSEKVFKKRKYNCEVVVQEVHVVDEVLKLQVDTIVKEKKQPIMKEQVLIRDDEA